MDSLKPGNLVKYSSYPHRELHNSNLVGLVITDAYMPEASLDFDPSEMLIDVIWNMDRGLSYPAGTICWEYPSELELVCENR